MDDKERSAIAVALKNIKENIPALFEMAQLDARLKFQKYNEFIKVGFTPEQALELCK